MGTWPWTNSTEVARLSVLVQKPEWKLNFGWSWWSAVKSGMKIESANNTTSSTFKVCQIIIITGGILHNYCYSKQKAATSNDNKIIWLYDDRLANTGCEMWQDNQSLTLPWSELIHPVGIITIGLHTTLIITEDNVPSLAQSAAELCLPTDPVWLINSLAIPACAYCPLLHTQTTTTETYSSQVTASPFSTASTMQLQQRTCC